jgi:CheY-like chemotaxis protein
MSLLKELQTIAKPFKILYVEDNKALRDKAKILLEKFFKSVDLASDGEIGLEMFKKEHYPIVISDIKMPHMDGMILSKEIKRIKPETKIIIMSAFDDKELLFKGIELGVFRFLTKPVNVEELAKVLYKAILEINHDQHRKIFYSFLKNIFNYQSSMLVMLHEKEYVLANEIFLDFFKLECSDNCKKSFTSIGERFLVHDGFLYNHDEIDVIDTVLAIPQKLFHAKLKAADGSLKHFILKYQSIPEKDGYGVLSFDDVTDVNFLGIFETKKSSLNKGEKNTKAVFDLLNIVHRNSAKVDVHNYYKGLSITNSGIISEINKESIVLKTSFIQLKAMQVEQKTYIVSSVLPNVVQASEIVKISFAKQEVELKLLFFMDSSPIERKTVRVVPNEKHSISLFLGESKFYGDIKIQDISSDAIALKLSALPAGLESAKEISLEIILELNKKPFTIKTEVKMLRKSESIDSFSLIFFFENLNKSSLIKYITKRQMELIREIKGMQNG